MLYLFCFLDGFTLAEKEAERTEVLAATTKASTNIIMPTTGMLLLYCC